MIPVKDEIQVNRLLSKKKARSDEKKETKIKEEEEPGNPILDQTIHLAPNIPQPTWEEKFSNFFSNMEHRLDQLEEKLSPAVQSASQPPRLVPVRENDCHQRLGSVLMKLKLILTQYPDLYKNDPNFLEIVKLVNQ